MLISGWVPKNFILILQKIFSEKTARRDYYIKGNNSLSFSKGDHIQIYKESQEWESRRKNWIFATQIYCSIAQSDRKLYFSDYDKNDIRDEGSAADLADVDTWC